MGNKNQSIFKKIEKDLAKLKFDQREDEFEHYSYSEELQLYQYIKSGDKKAIKYAPEMFDSPRTGKLSNDPVRHYQYMFVASITTACRFCIEGGMDPQESYGLSDLYIRSVDCCRSVEEIKELYKAMITDFTTRMANLRMQSFSIKIGQCLNYVANHIHDRLTVKQIAYELEMAESYLSVLFAKEVGISLSEYVRRQKVETARNLLEYFDYTCTDIAAYLGFSSESHFSDVFRRYTGMTPNQYKKVHYQQHFSERIREGSKNEL